MICGGKSSNFSIKEQIAYYRYKINIKILYYVSFTYDVILENPLSGRKLPTLLYTCIYLFIFFCICPVDFQMLYSSETYICLVLMYQSNFCKLLVCTCILFITFMYYQNVFCNINHCNDTAPCWDLDWTIKSYLIAGFSVKFFFQPIMQIRHILIKDHI